MKVLIVCSGNAPEGELFDLKLHQAFIYEQVESLKNHGVEFEYFFVKDKGFIGYIKHYRKLLKSLNSTYDLVHAHNGLCGFIANLQKRVPVITTYHGSDINLFHLRLFSYFPLLLSARNIFVSGKQKQKVLFKRRITTIPCGVNLHQFRHFLDRADEKSIFPTQNIKVLFSSSFSIAIKNYPLAFKAINMLGDKKIDLIELKNRTREEVCDLLNKSDLLLLTSFSEGSPMVIKEAMACNLPIVSTDVGDVREIFGNTRGCFICSFDYQDVAMKIRSAIEFAETEGRTNGRERIIELGLDNENVAEKVLEVYRDVLSSIV